LLIYASERLVGGVLVAADTTGVEIDRYEIMMKPNIKQRFRKKGNKTI